MTDQRWTVDAILRVTKDFFAAKGIESARLDAELLLCHVTGLQRVQLYTHYDRPLSDAERDAYRELVRRRGTLEPVAYILGEREFYGRPFIVRPGVLVPRPETEHLVDSVLEWARGAEPVRIADVGTGTGCIAVTLACELPAAQVVATDVEETALALAIENAAANGVSDRTEWLRRDLLPDGNYDAIVSNPPYIPEGDPRVAAGVHHHEPASALYSGPDGLDVIRRLVAQAPSQLRPHGLLAFEIGAGQVRAVSDMLPEVRFVEDLQGISRIAVWHAPCD
ncbi:MAG: peptide chain release factor N(5)-glutamine methyltransferase [Myxococcota bacterium]